MRETFPIEDVRRRFPALERSSGFLFFDNAAGAQIPDTVLRAVTDHLLSRNVQRGGPYRHSREVDAVIASARESVAAFVNARSAGEIAFGLNATSFIRAISLAVGQTLATRPEIIVSDLDHEANVATWLALERAGARIVWWHARVGDDGARLHPEDLEPLLTRAHQAGGLHDRVERDRHARRRRRCRAARARRRRGGLPRCGALRAARTDRRAGARLRLPGLLGIQGLRAAHGFRVVPPRGDRPSADVSRGLHPRCDAGQARGRHVRVRERRRHGCRRRIPGRSGAQLPRFAPAR